jgi:HEPN domain-containing protein
VRRQAAAAWLADARADLASARVLSAHRDEHGAPFAAAFHAEQAVEKALKALLVWHAVDYPPKHDLGLLQALLPPGLGTTSLDVGGLTVYAVELRYVAGASSPMDLLDRPSWDEADQAIELAGQALAVIADDLAAGGWTP